MDEMERQQAAMTQVRDSLLAVLDHHKEVCGSPEDCTEPLCMLAYLCHSCGVHSEHMEELGRQIDRADRLCREHRRGEICRN